MGLGSFIAAALPVAALANVESIAKVGAYKQQKKSVKAQRRLVDLQNRRAALNAVREARITRAAIIAGATAAGALTTSGAEGGIGSVTSQLGANLNFLNQSNALNQTAIKAQEKAGKYGAIGDIAGSIFSLTGGFQTIFSGGGTPTTGSATPTQSFNTGLRTNPRYAP